MSNWRRTLEEGKSIVVVVLTIGALGAILLIGGAVCLAVAGNLFDAIRVTGG